MPISDRRVAKLESVASIAGPLRRHCPICRGTFAPLERVGLPTRPDGVCNGHPDADPDMALKDLANKIGIGGRRR